MSVHIKTNIKISDIWYQKLCVVEYCFWPQWLTLWTKSNILQTFFYVLQKIKSHKGLYEAPKGVGFVFSYALCSLIKKNCTPPRNFVFLCKTFEMEIIWDIEIYETNVLYENICLSFWWELLLGNAECFVSQCRFLREHNTFVRGCKGFMRI